MAKKYLDDNGLLYFWQKIKSMFVTDVSYDSTNKKITKAKAGSTSDVVTIATVKSALSLTKSDVGLGNVDNTSDADKPISTATQTALNGKAASSHTHGNITNAGALQTNDVTIANGDKLVITDASDSNKVARASVAFDGSTATKALTQKGTFEAFNNYTHPSYTAANAAAVKVGRDATGHVVLGDALTKGDVGLGNVDNTADANKSVKQAGKLTNTVTIDGVQFNGSAAVAHYGECSTAAGTATKVVSCTNFTAVTGAIIYVKFTVTNTAAVADLTLSVNGITGKPIKYRNANLPSAGALAANRVYCFVYDGTNYQLVGDLDTNTTYSALSQADANAGSATAARLITANVLHNKVWNEIDKVKFDGDDGSSPASSGAQYVLTLEDADDNELTSAAIPSATTSAAGVMSSADKTKLNGIATGAEVNQNAFSEIKVGNGVIGASSKTDQFELKSGSNVTLGFNTGTKIITISATDTVTTATTTGSGNAVTSVTASNGALTVTKGSTFIASSEKGAASGVCPLNSSKKIDATYLPSYVDDVIEAYARSGQTALSSTWLATGSATGTAITPEAGKIYVLMADSGDYAANTQFRWSGTSYVKLADGGVSSITNAEIDTIVAS